MNVPQAFYEELSANNFYLDQDAVNVNLNFVAYEEPIKLFEYTNIYGSALIGAHSYINKYFNVSDVTIGRFCSFASYIREVADHNPSNLSTHPLFVGENFAYYLPKITEKIQILKSIPNPKNYKNRTIIKNDVWIGEGVLIKSGITIGNGAIVGANSFVKENVPDYAVVAGCPAKIIRYRFPESVISRLNEIRWWDYNVMEFADQLFDKDINQVLDFLSELIEKQALTKINYSKKLLKLENSEFKIYNFVDQNKSLEEILYPLN